ncbi:MAG: methylated-DNA--[protein]-cysteine S-methyltransferase [bacterium]|jgi:methylated-DNA-[protein]-cysteine S-methyltransferase
MPVYGVIEPLPPFRMAAVAGFRGLERLSFGGEVPGCERNDEHPLIRETARQLAAYFRGELRSFDLPLDPAGTEFHMRVWAALSRIPYGEVRSYASIAKELGTAARAVGQANAANPIAIVLPCHRVIAADGSLGGYSGGLERKQYLLDLERTVVLAAKARATMARLSRF